MTSGYERARAEAQQQIKSLSDETAEIKMSHDLEVRRLLGEVEKLKRQLESKSANLGPLGEINLFEKLKDRFPDDRIRRVEKGSTGADIIHVVVKEGRECGTIIYECKNTTARRGDYVTKLREDQIAEGAEHAILSTLKLPAECDQLDIHIQDGVIICLPGRVPVIAEILRRDILRSYELRRFGNQPEQKKEALYSYIVSSSFRQNLESIDIVTREMLEVDTSEGKAHKKVWRKRAALIKSMKEAEENLRSEIEEIIDAE